MTDALQRLSSALSDRYRLERELGQGGMATVYLAEDLRHQRKVAIKVLRPELAAVIGAERFVREIRTIAALQHPHILGLIDSGEVQGTAYYVMPFVEGESLRDRLSREKQLPIADAVRIAMEVAGALDYAHRHGVIHRDIKPENVLLHEGSAMVADFGIALAVSSAGGTRMTETGMSLGTPQYMSPEQAMGEREITTRSDVYALGCVTYEMLLGEPPFTGPTAQAIVAKMMTEKPASLIPRRERVPPAVEEAVLTALEKLPADRFASAAEFGAALAAGRPEGREKEVRRTGPARRSNRSSVLLATALALAVVSIAVAFVLGRQLAARQSPLDALGRATKVTWDRGLEIEPSLSPDGKYVAYAAGNTTSMRIFVRQVAGGRAVRLTDDSLEIQTNPSWSPDGARILFLSNGGVFSAPSSGGAARPEMHSVSGGTIIAAVWAPDGKRIGFSIGDSLFIRDEQAVRPLARIAEASLCQWSPNGALIACASGNSYYSRVGSFFGNLSPSRIVVTRVQDGATVTITDSTSINQSPAWSPDGEWLYYLSSRLGPRDIYATHITSDGHARGGPIRLTAGLGAQTISVSADGRRLAYAAYVGTSNIWSLPFPPNGATQASARPVTSGSQTIEGGWASPDGKWFWFPSDLSGNAEIYRMRLPDGEPEQLTFDPSDDFSPRVSPDGREVAFHSWRSGSRDIYILPLDGGPVQPVVISPGHQSQPFWSPDGRALTFNTFGIPGGIWVVRRDEKGGWGKPVQRSPFGSWPSWSPDGRWIAFTSRFMGGNLMIVSPDSGTAWVLVDSARTGFKSEMPVWRRDSHTLYFNNHDSKGNESFWSVPLSGGTPKLLTRFTDPTMPAYRPEWSVGGDRMYFAIQDRQSDIWVMETSPP